MSNASLVARSNAQRLRDIAASLPVICEALNEAVRASADLPAVEQARQYKFIKDAYDAFGKAKEDLNAINDYMSREAVPEAMRREGIKTMTVEGVGRVSLSNRYSCSILPDENGSKEPGYDWLKANGADSLITSTVNSSSLSAFAKNKLEEEGVELPPDLFKVGVMTYTSITKK